MDADMVSVEAGGFGAWRLAARPRTLGVAVAPVVTGTAVAFSLGGARALPALAALVSALLITVGTNFANDVFDHEKGADAEDRVGPVRAVQQGLLSARQMRLGAAVAFGLAALPGLYLVAVGGWPVLLIGVLSMAAGFAYTGGPWPLGYHGLGDLTVFVFFGLVAVCGTVYVQMLAVPSLAVATAVPVGALATAILVVNNVRDRSSDARTGKRTLAVRLGPRGGRVEYCVLVAAAFVSCPLLWLLANASVAVLLPALLLPRAWVLTRTVLTCEDGATWNETLAATAQLLVGFSFLLSLGLLL